jgi:hypothetical protein
MWVFEKDTRMLAATMFENLEAGLSVEEVMEEFSVTREQINAVLHFAAKNLQMPLPPPVEATPPVVILFDHGTPRSIARWLHGSRVRPVAIHGQKDPAPTEPQRPADRHRDTWQFAAACRAPLH